MMSIKHNGAFFSKSENSDNIFCAKNEKIKKNNNNKKKLPNRHLLKNGVHGRVLLGDPSNWKLRPRSATMKKTDAYP